MQILLVIGGRTGSDYLDSAELFDANIGSWSIIGAALPNAMSYLRAATVDNRVFIFGIDILY